MTPTPELIALGGNSAEFPEHTVPAVRSAAELGASAVLLDIECSRDRVPLLWPAPRTTPAAAPGHRAGGGLATASRESSTVVQSTAADLLRLEVAERERFGDRHLGLRVASLADAATTLARHSPATRLYLRLGAASLLAHGGCTPLAPAILAALGVLAARAVLVLSDLAAIGQARRAGFGASGWELGAYDTPTQIKCEALCPDVLLARRALLGGLRAGGSLWRGPWRWIVTDVETPDAARELARRGAHGIATRRVRAMMRELAATASTAANPTQATVPRSITPS